MDLSSLQNAKIGDSIIYFKNEIELEPYLILNNSYKIIGTEIISNVKHLIILDELYEKIYVPISANNFKLRTKTREQKVLDQVEIFNQINQADFNIVNCGHCGSVVLHVIDDSEEIECPYCDRIMDKSDCPDFLYEGVELSGEFQETKKTPDEYCVVYSNIKGQTLLLPYEIDSDMSSLISTYKKIGYFNIYYKQ